jgi:hypothetical protein
MPHLWIARGAFHGIGNGCEEESLLTPGQLSCEAASADSLRGTGIRERGLGNRGFGLCELRGSG